MAPNNIPPIALLEFSISLSTMQLSAISKCPGSGSIQISWPASEFEIYSTFRASDEEVAKAGVFAQEGGYVKRRSIDTTNLNREENRESLCVF
jgi:hypothetical protein